MTIAVQTLKPGSFSADDMERSVSLSMYVKKGIDQGHISMDDPQTKLDLAESALSFMMEVEAKDMGSSASRSDMGGYSQEQWTGIWFSLWEDKQEPPADTCAVKAFLTLLIERYAQLREKGILEPDEIHLLKVVVFAVDMAASGDVFEEETGMIEKCHSIVTDIDRWLNSPSGPSQPSSRGSDSGDDSSDDGHRDGMGIAEMNKLYELAQGSKAMRILEAAVAKL